MHDIMIDLETTGTRPDRHAIIQIAAVKFDLATQDVDPAVFNMCLSIPPARSWDEGTREWWLNKPEVLRSILLRQQDPYAAMHEFMGWVGRDRPRMWAKPITFEFPFLSSYFHDFGIHNPFSFREAMDCRAYLTGLAHPLDFISEKELAFEGTAHDAIFDVFHQIKWLFHNQRTFRPAVLGATITSTGE